MGLLIAIDGVDASGKQTHCELLRDSLKKSGYNVRMLSFPVYDSDSSALVKMYLSGELSPNAEDISAYAAATFFAADRYASYMRDWKKSFAECDVIIADRYVSSNMIHQAAKLATIEEKNEFLQWLDNLEYGIYGLPRPEITLFLDMPPEFGRQLSQSRANKIDNSDTKDIHERDFGYLEKSYKNACYISNKLGWKHISCVENGKIRSIDEIQKEISGIVMTVLKNRKEANFNG